MYCRVQQQQVPGQASSILQQRNPASQQRFNAVILEILQTSAAASSSRGLVKPAAKEPINSGSQMSTGLDKRHVLLLRANL